MTSKPLPKIGIVSGGGDCPGINTVIYSSVRASVNKYEVWGIKNGFEGLLEQDLEVLTPEGVYIYQGLGGTMLGTASKGKFAAKRGTGDVDQIDASIVEETFKAYNDLGLKAIISIGGDGSMTTSLQLQMAGINIVGVPKTIDNDLNATDKTFGFDSAIEYVTDAIDRIKTTATSHHRVFIIEVMGRHAGWIALESGIAGAAHMVLIPEIPFKYDTILEFLKFRQQAKKKFTVIIIAEGAHASDETECISRVRPDGEALLGGAADKLLCYLESSLKDQEVRSVVLGHLQRGGKPSATDRVLAALAGAKAVEMIDNKEFGKMVCYKGDSVSTVDIKDAVKNLKVVDPSSPLVKVARDIGIHFGDKHDTVHS